MTAMRLKRYPSPSGGIALGKMGVGATMMRQSPLPPGARWVEYLGSTGTQWIDTGFKPSPETTRCEALLSYTSVADIKGLFGARPVSTGNYQSAYLWGRRADWVGNSNTNMSITTGVDHTIVCENNTVRVDDTIYSTSIVKASYYLAYTFYLFTVNNYGTPVSQGGQPQRLKMLKLYDNGTLVRSFAPIAIGTTGYMLDLVSGEYLPYGNAGTGDFVLGPDINAPAI